MADKKVFGFHVDFTTSDMVHRVSLLSDTAENPAFLLEEAMDVLLHKSLRNAREVLKSQGYTEIPRKPGRLACYLEFSKEVVEPVQ